MSVAVTPGRFTAINVDLRNLLTVTYRLPWFRITNLPSWASDRYDVVATFPVGADQVHLGEMLRNLLIERFMLRTHTEARDQPVYALVTTSSDRLGPQLRRSAIDCAAATPTGETSAPAVLAHCREQLRLPGHIVVRGMPLDALANFLSGVVQDRVVVEQTGLQGNFDLELRFAAPTSPQGANDEQGTSLFTALQEQLGLRLEPRRAAVEVLVVDSIARPSPD